MQYKNLNSLSKAYRSGDVDRSTYIQQRRQLIDTITASAIEDNEDITVTSTKSGFDEATTVISNAAELAGEKTTMINPPHEKRQLLWKRLLPAAILVALTTACGIFYLRNFY